MVREQPDYISYLLRLRRASSTGKAVWRASLESPQTGACVSFASLDTLFDFLRQQTEARPNIGKGGDLSDNTG